MDDGVGKIQLTKSWRVEDSSPFCFSIKFQFGPEKRYSAPSPIIEMKAQKNDVEIRGMVEAHLRDAVIFCDAMAFIEDQVGVHKNRKLGNRKVAGLSPRKAQILSFYLS